MERLLLVVLLVALAALVAFVLERRRPDAPTQPRWAVPSQLDRADFARPDAAWLVAVFTSATCDACAKTARDAAVLASDEVGVDVVDVGARAEVHRRYAIDAVPLVAVADRAGVVRASWVGPPTATDLWGALAELRQPGAVSDPELHRRQASGAGPEGSPHD